MMTEPKRIGSSRVLRWAALGALYACAVSACADSEPAHGQLMVALETDMSVPKDVTHIRLLARVGGEVKYQYDFPIAPDGTFIIPGTFAIVAGKALAPTVGVEVVGMRKNAAGDTSSRTFSKVITTIPRERKALLRVPVQWLCDESALPPFVAHEDTENDLYSSTCEPIDGQETACVAGACVPVVVPESTLPTYDPRLVFGGAMGPNAGGECFDTVPCFDAGSDVTADDDCTLPLPADLENFNVGFAFPPGTDGICDDERPTAECYVPLEKSDRFGWRVGPRPNGDESTEVVVLPPAACAKVKAKKARSLRVTGACPTRVESMPTCGPWSSATVPAVSGDGGAGPVAAGGSSGSGGEEAGGGGEPAGGTSAGGASAKGGSGGRADAGGEPGVAGDDGLAGNDSASGGSTSSGGSGAVGGDAGAGGSAGSATRGGSSGAGTAGAGMGGTGSTFTCSDPLVFPDPNLEAGVRSALALPTGDITKAIADTLLSLNVPNAAISDLTGVQCLANLTGIALDGNPVSDLSPLASLADLTSLVVAGDPVSNLSPLGELTNLVYLDVSSTDVTSIEALADLSVLETLDLSATGVTDLSPLSPLSALRNLTLTLSPSLDLSPLASCAALRAIYSTDSGYADLPAIAALGLPLLVLELYQADISDLTPLSGMTSLQDLYLNGNQITDVGPLSSLTDLRNLYLSANYITDVAPLAGLTQLQSLFLALNEISSVTPLASLTSLTTLGLGSNPVDDITSLATLTGLQYLYLEGTGVSDISTVSGMTQLSALNLSNTAVSDLTPLSALPNLYQLYLMQTLVTDLTPLASNLDFADGDYIDLSDVYLDCVAQAANISALRDRGVDLYTSCP